jgi:hypothetical protein
LLHCPHLCSSFDLRSSSGQHWKDTNTLGDRGYVYFEESPRTGAYSGASFSGKVAAASNSSPILFILFFYFLVIFPCLHCIIFLTNISTLVHIHKPSSIIHLFGISPLCHIYDDRYLGVEVVPEHRPGGGV